MQLLTQIPAKYRKIIYITIATGLFIYSLWQASEGNWEQFVLSLLTSAGSTLASANTDTASHDNDYVDYADVPDTYLPEGNFVTDSAGTWNADDIGDPTPAGE